MSSRCDEKAADARRTGEGQWWRPGASPEGLAPAGSGSGGDAGDRATRGHPHPAPGSHLRLRRRHCSAGRPRPSLADPHPNLLPEPSATAPEDKGEGSIAPSPAGRGLGARRGFRAACGEPVERFRHASRNRTASEGPAADVAFSSQPAWGEALRAVCVVAALVNGMTIHCAPRLASHLAKPRREPI